jgi:dihydropteroate synthase
MAAVAARYRAPVNPQHNRSNQLMPTFRHDWDYAISVLPIRTLLKISIGLMESVAAARAAGVEDRQIILDPGIGFGKTVEQNLTLVNRLSEIKALGFPVLLGPSRKSFIGYTLNLPPEERVEGTAAVCAIGIARGADIIRVHDVEVMVRIARMADAVVR